jgi:6,7-dimethyl-8-ribityllumazine synthase
MKKILIINSNYYKNISNDLLKNSLKKLSSENFHISVVEVPGIFEIPISIRRNIKKFDGFIALGCVIKGETPHFDLICDSTFNAILKISIMFNKPIGNGIITALNINQALSRSKILNKKKANKGSEAAKAVISILKNEPKKI